MIRLIQFAFNHNGTLLASGSDDKKIKTLKPWYKNWK